MTFIIIFMISCDKQLSQIVNNPPENYFLGDTLPQPPEYIHVTGVSLPSFPAVTLHIIDREYEIHKNDQGFNYTKDEYFEYRLLELCPDSAYEGLMDDASEEYETNMQNCENYLDSLQAWADSNNVDSILIEEEFPDFSNIEDETDIMDMTEDEADEWEQLEDIASEPFEQRIMKEELDSLIFGQNHVPYRMAASEIIALTAVVIKAGISIYRVIMVYKRSYDKLDEWYKPINKDDPGYRGDAFKHCFMSMQLQRYFATNIAIILTEGWEIIHKNPQYRDTYMDRHNNYVGMIFKYWKFRGNPLTHIYDWEQWALNTMSWIEIENINGYFLDWYDPIPSIQQCKNEGKDAPYSKYIYYRL